MRFCTRRAAFWNKLVSLQLKSRGGPNEIRCEHTALAISLNTSSICWLGVASASAGGDPALGDDPSGGEGEGEGEGERALALALAFPFPFPVSLPVTGFGFGFGLVVLVTLGPDFVGAGLLGIM